MLGSTYEIKLKPEAPRVGCLPNFKNIFKQNGDKPNEFIYPKDLTFKISEDLVQK